MWEPSPSLYSIVIAQYSSVIKNKSDVTRLIRRICSELGSVSVMRSESGIIKKSRFDSYYIYSRSFSLTNLRSPDQAA